MTSDVLVIAPFRRPTFRKAISSTYPTQEPWDSAPLSVAAALEQSGLSVAYLALQNIFDGWNEQRDLPLLQHLLADAPARMVLFSSDYFIASRSTATIYGLGVTAAQARKLHPDVVIGVVGRLATTAGERLLREIATCDFVVHGEPEQIIGDLAGDILSKGLGNTYHASLRKRQGGTAGLPLAAARNDNLDSVAAPAWHLLGPSIAARDKVQGQPGKLPFSLRTSAGCKFRCRFCAGVPNWLDYRVKSAQRMALEIDTLQDATSGRAHLSFLEDEIFTRHMSHVEAVSSVFRERELMVDGVYTHSTLMTPEVAALLSQMARKVYFGLDNPSDALLREMRKGQNLSTVLAAVETAREAGLASHLEWIIGSPPDDVDSLSASLNAIVNLLATGAVESIDTYVYCPHPGTEYAEQAEAFGMQIVDGFEDMQESGGYPAYQTKKLTSQQVYTAYLMSQVAIAETLHARSLRGPTSLVGQSNRAELRRIFGKVRGEA